MLLAAAKALAGVIPNSALHEEYIIPSVFDKHVVPRVSKAVAKAARMTDVARRSLKHGLAMR
jgi:malate dehydrogenase (oxaloacetate-decarboxylating)